MPNHNTPLKPFAKGNPGGPGRPPGMKNKNCMNPIYWFNLIQEESETMAAEKKIEYAFKALELLMPKVQNLPATPEDSKANADKAMEELIAAENYGLNRDSGDANTKPGSNGANVEAGASQGQTTT